MKSHNLKSKIDKNLDGVKCDKCGSKNHPSWMCEELNEKEN